MRRLCTTCTLQIVIVNVLSVISRWGGKGRIDGEATTEATTEAKWQVYRRASQRGSKGCWLRAIDRDRRPVPT